MANFSSDEGESYEVDRIIDLKKQGRTTQYLVRWKGYDSDEDSWETEKNLKGSSDAIDEFKRKQGSIVESPHGKRLSKQMEESITKQTTKGGRNITHSTTVTKVTRITSGTKSESSSPESSPIIGRRTLQTQSLTSQSGSFQQQRKKCAWSLCPASLAKNCNVCKMDFPTIIVLMCFLFIILTFVVQLPK